MEVVLCPTHNRPCVLKTGTQPGNNYGVSFFMCVANYQNQKCTFVQRSKAATMSCPVHGKMVGLRILSKSNKFSYRCSGISSGKVCGQMDMKQMKENLDPEPLGSISSTSKSKSSFASPDTTHGSPSDVSDLSSRSETKSSSSSSCYSTAKTQRYNNTSSLSSSSTGKYSDSSGGESVKSSPQTVDLEESRATASSSSPGTISDMSSNPGSHKSSTTHIHSSSTVPVSDDRGVRSGYHVPDAPTNVSELFANISGQNESVEMVQSNKNRVSLANNGSPLLNSPASLKYRGGSKGVRRSSNSDENDSRCERSLSLSSEGRESDTSQADSDQDGREGDEGEDVSNHSRSSNYTPSPSLNSTIQSEEEQDQESDGEEDSRGRSMFMDHSASMSSHISSQSEREEESDASIEMEEGGEVLAKSFSKYRTTTQSDSDSDKEEREEEDEGDSETDEGGRSLVEGTGEASSGMNGSELSSLCINSSGAQTDLRESAVEDSEEESSFADSANPPNEDEEVSALYYSCMSDGTPAPPTNLSTIESSRKKDCFSSVSGVASPINLPSPESLSKKDNPSLSDGYGSASTLPPTAIVNIKVNPEKSVKKINHSPTNGCSSGSVAQDGANSKSHDYSSPLNSSQSSSVIVLDSESKPRPKPLGNVSHSPIVLSPDTVPVDQLSNTKPKPKSLEACGDGGASGSTASGGRDDDDDTHVDKEVTKAEPQFQVGYQYRTVVKQLMETQTLIQTMSHRLPDGGASLKQRKEALLARLEKLKRPTPDLTHPARAGPDIQMHHKNRLTYQAKMLTVGAVEHLHSSLSNCPTEDTLADTPGGFKVELMKHQRRALAWMLWREAQTPSAGILADDMGLGKTLSLISLVMNKKKDGVKEWLAKPVKEGLVKSTGTLVVCPASLMMQWEGEVKSKLRPHALTTKVYHGSNRTRFAHDLAAYDVVITTYNIVGIEGGSCEEEDPAQQSSSFKPKKKKRTSSTTTLFKVHWRRVILDEAHVIRNHKTALSIGACKLESDYRWAVTGTPIQNQLKDFYSLIKFIRLAPFDDYRVWRDTVERKGSLGMKRLDTVVSSLVLRRTKEDVDKKALKLTKRNTEFHTIKLLEEEKQVYDILFAEARKVMCSWLQEQGQDVSMDGPSSKTEEGPGQSVEAESTDGGGGAEEKPPVPLEVERLVNTIIQPYLIGSSKGRCVLGLLLRLRQCCCHLSLLTSALRHNEGDQDDMDLELAMGSLSLGGGGGTAGGREEAEDKGGANGGGSYRYGATDNIPTEFLKEQRSTKVLEVLKELKSISAKSENAPEKSVIVSQWTSMLNIMQHHLEAVGITHVRIDGTVPPSKRLEKVELFNNPKKDPSVMLLSLQAGGVGLNLIGGNHIFMLDMHWNPALETQAGDRCHRMGQKRDVFIHKFVCEGTVEERILMLQKKKLELAQSVLDGASEQGRARFKRNNQLSLNDLKLLFEIQ